MDLTSLKMLTSTIVEIVHPDTLEPLGITITLASPDSAKVKAMRDERVNRRLQAMAKGRSKTVPTVDELESEALAMLVAATLEWSGIEIGSAELDCTPENVRNIYADPAFAWLRKQVDEAFGDQVRFFQK
jgi:hypothetical protein